MTRGCVDGVDGLDGAGGADGAVIGVLGGSGGVGASSFAAVLAAVATRSVLVDLDPVGGGVDVALGIEDVPGARWSGLRLDGGRLDPVLLAEGLPRWGRVPVLAADVAPPAPAAIEQVLDAAAELGTAVLDLPRAPCASREGAARRCTLVVAVVAARVRDLAAARAVLASLPPGVPVGAVVRRGAFAPDESAALAGAPLLGVLPALTRARELDARRLPRAPVRVATGILDGLSA
ncbi:MAG: pilus assembly protein FlpE [Jatrophihabitantaceae bacterium]